MMRKALPKKPNVKTTPASPINFRMPAELRVRLRRFAKERHLAEAEALRLVVSEHLEEVENERELAAAERWQFKQAYATWQRLLRGEERLVPWEEIEKIFSDARAGRLSRPTK
jgi:predicted DNA-binding protein